MPGRGYQYVLTLVCCAALCTCRKDVSLEEEQQSAPPLPDSIIYLDLDPDTSIVPYSYYGFQGNNDLDIEPHDSTASMRFDLDGDGTNDLGIATTHHEDWHSPHCCHNWLSSVGQCTGSSLEVRNIGLLSQWFGLKADAVDSMGLISAADQWGNWANMQVSYYDPSTSWWIGEETYYIGLRMLRNGSYCYGWARMSGTREVTLHSYALNLTPGNPIRAGQTE